MIQKLFNDIFNEEPLVVRSPVPMRLLGEHHACNDGHVLTVATNNWVRVAVCKRADAGIHLFSTALLERVELLPTDLLVPVKIGWIKPVIAVLNQFNAKGHAVAGVNVLIDVKYIEPGVPCSGSIEVALYLAVNELFGLGLTKPALMAIARPSFDPDFYTCLYGKRSYALKIDTREQTHEYIALRLGDYSMVLFILANSPATPIELQRNRLEACEQVLQQLRAVQSTIPGNTIKTIRDTNLLQLYNHIKDADIRRRAGFLLRENTRVIAAATNLQAGNFSAFGQKLYESDDGLVNEFETGAPEANWLIDELDWKEYVTGGRRLTGAWRNAVYAIIRSGKMEETTLNIARAYERHWERKLLVVPVVTAGGAEVQQDHPEQKSKEHNRFV